MTIERNLPHTPPLTYPAMEPQPIQEAPSQPPTPLPDVIEPPPLPDVIDPADQAEGMGNRTRPAEEAPIDSRITDLFPDLMPGDPIVDDIMARLEFIEHVPVIPEYEEIEADYRNQFSQMIENLTPEQLTELKGRLEEKAANIDYELVGSSSMIPQYLDMVNEKLAAEGQGDGPIIPPNIIRILESQYPMSPEGFEMADQMQEQFNHMISDLSDQQLQALQETLQNKYDDFVNTPPEEILVGSGNMFSRFLESVQQQMDNQSIPPALERAIEEISNYPMSPEGFEMAEGLQEQFEQIISHLSDQDLQNLQEHLQNKFEEFQNAPMITGSGTMLPRFIESIQQQLGNQSIPPSLERAIEEISNYPMSPEGFEMADGLQQQFEELINGLSEQHLQTLQSHLQNKLTELTNSPPEEMVIGSGTMLPRFIESIQEQLSNQTLPSGLAEAIESIEHVPVIPGALEIANEYMSQFSEMIQQLEPEQLSGLQHWLEEKVANIDHTIAGSQSLMPHFLEMVNNELAIPDAGTPIEAIQDAIEQIEHLPVVPDMDEIAQEKLNEFKNIITGLDMQDLEQLRGWLEEKASSTVHYEDGGAIAGSRSLAPEFFDVLSRMIEDFRP